MRSTQHKPSETKAAAATRTVATLEQLEDRKYQAADQAIGMNVNAQTAAEYAKSIPLLKQLGVTNVRLWYSITDWNKHKVDGVLARAIDYKNAGFDVMMTVHIEDKKVPNPADVKSWYAWAAGNDALAQAIDRWEIGNEVDSSHYWNGTLKQYVSNVLKPASDALHAAGEKVVSAGVSWNPEDVREMIGYGMLNMVDYVGFHPYAKGVSSMKSNIAKLQDIVGDRKPLLASEWNVRGFENDKSNWAEAVKDAYPIVHSGFDLDYYYCLFTANTMAGPGGLINRSTGAANASFYNAFLQASRGFVGGVGSTPPSTGGNTGNTPSAAVTKIALYDATTDRVISGYSDLKAGQVINLADLPTRNLAIVVIPDKKAESVKMTFNGETQLQNSLPYAVFGDSGSDVFGRQLSAGNYSLSVTPYLKDNAQGTAFATRTLNFSFINKPAVPVKQLGVTDYSLINAKTGAVIKGYEHLTGTETIKLSGLTGISLALRANTEGDVDSVKLTANGKSHIENVEPYAVFGDYFGKFVTWKPTKGTYNISGIGYDLDNAKGQQGATSKLVIKFV